MAQKPKVDPHVGRLGYLQALVTEFQETQSQDAKEQVLANLANFAYDPSNYEYLRQLQVLDLFLDSLSEENEALVEFAIAPSSSLTDTVHQTEGLQESPCYCGGCPSSWRPVQPVPRPGQQGAHPAGRRRPTHHQLPVQPQRGDSAVRHYHAHAPEPAGPQLFPGADRRACGAVHASLLPLGQCQAPEPGADLPGGLLLPAPGGRGPQPAGALRPGYPTAEEHGPTAALIHGDRETVAPLLLETTVLMWTQGTGLAAPLVRFQPFARRVLSAGQAFTL
ncbi:armadillo repeat-containing protein 7 isoform X1 [Trachypithecus francoisi]|uniref:armadillo repeat-containing protein 7 isoform X1 n=1 Tax=Trachypithecus francoisi TaxID=54180 RepID=UPI00141BBEF6|nr:armadillo repeat-containing protein 7 isoform X1 [Trachypithecus francoisi]